MDFLYLFKDINFQKGFLIVAVLILIMMTLNVAYNLKKVQVGEEGWPPKIAPCPDYWDISLNYCINTNGKNLGNIQGEYSIWENEVVCNNTVNDLNNPYYAVEPIICSNYDKLRTIPVGIMHRGGKNKLVGGNIVNGTYVNIKKKRSKMSRRDWANKYGFSWDGLNTKW